MLALQDAERTSNVTSAACHLVHRAEETMSSGKEVMLEIEGSGVLQEQRMWDVVFSHLAARNLLRGGTVLFVRARQVARAWLEAVNKALPLLASLSFPVHARATDVVNVLMSVAGNNLKAVCLEGCLQLSAVDVERILQCLAGGCPAVVEVNLAGCRDEAILRALATAAKRQFSAISPEDLRAMLLALAAEDAASRCPLERLLLHLTSPRLRVADVGRDFAPGRDALRQAVECAIEDEAAVYDVLVLLILTFCAGEDEETITFDCNQRILADEEENEEDRRIILGRVPCIWRLKEEALFRFCTCSYSPAQK